jgi:hypothetical protein
MFKVITTMFKAKSGRLTRREKRAIKLFREADNEKNSLPWML